MQELKDKFLNEETIKRCLFGIMCLVVVATVVSVVVTRVRISHVRDDLVKVRSEMEGDEPDESTEQDDAVVSASSMGRRVANLETSYSKNCGEILRVDSEYDGKDAADRAAKEITDRNKSVVELLSEYFEDDSYKEAWYPGHTVITSPCWDFGTKYSIDASADTVPVVWVCYDSRVGGTVLGYTKAVWDVKAQKFRDASTVLTNVDGMYGMDVSSSGSFLQVMYPTGSDDGSMEGDMDDVSDESDGSGAVGESEGIEVTDEGVTE